jgi:citrate synthase
MADDDPRWIDAAQAAQRLGVKSATLYSYVSRGLLHRRRHADGRRSLFDATEIAALRRRNAGAADGGTFAWASAITYLGADRPYYRGRDALRLARGNSFESVAEWLWTGEEPPRPGPWTTLPGAVSAAVAAQAALPAQTLLLDRLQLIVTALAVGDPMRFTRDHDGVITTGRALIAGMVDALPQRSRRSSPATSTIAKRLWHKLTPAPPDPASVGVLESALVLLADHELAASTVAARVAASVAADPYAVVCAALGVLGGPMHGGASLGAYRMLAQMNDPADAPRVIGERLRRGERIPGLGHPVYTAGDERGRLLLDLVGAAVPDHPRLAVARAAVHETAARGLPAPNIDFSVATLAAVSGMAADAGEAIFAIARTAGWLAHALEEYLHPAPVRPRATYVGPPPEDAIQNPS